MTIRPDNHEVLVKNLSKFPSIYMITSKTAKLFYTFEIQKGHLAKGNIVQHIALSCHGRHIEPEIVSLDKRPSDPEKHTL